jgi:hypothetical protein
MPFDGANFAFSASEVLESAISAIGLEAIDTCVLDRHKGEQIRRNPAGWAYRHQQAVALAQVAVLLAGVGLCVFFLSMHETGWGIAGGVALFGLGSSTLFLPVRGPALWHERIVVDLHEVPVKIREPALRLQRRLPEVEFVVGELFQNRVKLDPYLIAQYSDARVVLGIWDGNEVIARPSSRAQPS